MGEQIPEDLAAILAWSREVIRTIWALTWPDSDSALTKTRESLIDLLMAEPEVDDTLQRELIVVSNRLDVRRLAEVYDVDARHSLDVVRELGWRALELAHAECTKLLQLQAALLRETTSTQDIQGQLKAWTRAIAAMEAAKEGQTHLYQERIVEEAFGQHPTPARDSTPNAPPPVAPKPGGDLDLEVEKTIHHLWHLRKESVTRAKPKSQRTVPKDIELRGKAEKLTELLWREEQERAGRGLEDMLSSLNIPKDTFYKSKHFKGARRDWERLKGAREVDRDRLWTREPDDNSY